METPKQFEAIPDDIGGGNTEQEEERTKDLVYSKASLKDRLDVDYALARIAFSIRNMGFSKATEEFREIGKKIDYEWPNYGLEVIPEELLRSETFKERLIELLEDRLIDRRNADGYDVGDGFIKRAIAANSIKGDDELYDYPNRESLVKFLSLCISLEDRRVIGGMIPEIYEIQGTYTRLEKAPFTVEGKKFNRKDFDSDVEKMREYTVDKVRFKEVGITSFINEILRTQIIVPRSYQTVLWGWDNHGQWVEKIDNVCERIENLGILKDPDLKNKLVKWIKNNPGRQNKVYDSSQDERLKLAKKELSEILKEATLDTLPQKHAIDRDSSN